MYCSFQTTQKYCKVLFNSLFFKERSLEHSGCCLALASDNMNGVHLPKRKCEGVSGALSSST